MNFINNISQFIILSINKSKMPHFQLKCKLTKSGKKLLSKFDKKRLDQKMIKSICQMRASVDNTPNILNIHKKSSDFRKHQINNQIHFNNIKMIKKIVEIREDSNKKGYQFNHNPQYNQFKRTRSKLMKFVRKVQQNQLKKENEKLIDRILRTTSTFQIFNHNQKPESSHGIKTNKKRQKSLQNDLLLHSDSLKNIILGSWNNQKKFQSRTQILRSKTSYQIDHPQSSKRNNVNIKTESNQTRTQLKNKKAQRKKQLLDHKTGKSIDLSDFFILREKTTKKSKYRFIDQKQKIINKSKLLKQKNLFYQQTEDQYKKMNNERLKKNKSKKLIDKNYKELQKETKINKYQQRTMKIKRINTSYNKGEFISFTQSNLINQE